MSAHGREPVGGRDREAERRRLRLVLALTAGYMVVEVIGGVWAGSLALLADAGHMLTDVASVALALAALWAARRPATTRHTYAFARAEILAALLNGLALWGIVVWITVEAMARLRSPEPVLAGPMLAVAAGGLVVNALALAVLHRGHRDARERSLNVYGVLLHVIGDFLGSVGALVAGVIIWWTGWTRADPLASLLIAGLILVSSWGLVREAVHILLEGVPRHLDLDELISAIAAIEGVAGVHDLHVWTITSGYPALSAHVVCGHEVEREMLMARVNRVLRDRFGIGHTTIQLEAGAPPGHAAPMTYPIETLE